jgi:hypothetical protein
MAKVLYIFYISKAYEMFDTVGLRKQRRSMTVVILCLFVDDSGFNVSTEKE